MVNIQCQQQFPTFIFDVGGILELHVLVQGGLGGPRPRCHHVAVAATAGIISIVIVVSTTTAARSSCSPTIGVIVIIITTTTASDSVRVAAVAAIF